MKIFETFNAAFLCFAGGQSVQPRLPLQAGLVYKGKTHMMTLPGEKKLNIMCISSLPAKDDDERRGFLTTAL